MNTYYPVSKQELEDYLIDKFAELYTFDPEDYIASEEWQEKHPFAGSTIEEYGYYAYPHRNIALKIYSGISRDDDEPISRGSGFDAIRIAVCCADCYNPILRSQKRINRLRTWSSNFDKRVIEILEALGNQVDCVGCKKRRLLTKRNGENLLACPSIKTSKCTTEGRIVRRSMHRCATRGT